VSDLKKGDKISPKDVRSVRPGYGLAPKHLDRVIGRTVLTDVQANTPVRDDLFD
jgi:N-acetylneuraminate synthase